jgi:hypothetical protein
MSILFTTIIEDAVRTAELTDLTMIEADPIQHRTALLAKWCAIYTDLESTMDPSFDENKPPTSGSLGIGGPPGPERDARRREAAGKREAYAAWFNPQLRLRHVERRANESLGRFVKRYYTSSPPDRAEFDMVLQSTRLPAPRAEQFRRLFNPSPPSQP